MMGGNTETTNKRTLFGSLYTADEEQHEDIDFKMVTFSLGGKDYGVDIMSVKEISRYESFTYVPNTEPFVVGVYNLRGEIISVVDMRIMFNLPAPRRPEGQPEDGLILRLETGLIGMVVDSIDRVVGISSESIQPPHPIFADINLKYISGVVEHEDRLYIILDVERILGESVDDDTHLVSVPHGDGDRQPVVVPDEPAPDIAGDPVEMVAPTLQTLSGFCTTVLNRSWVEKRLLEWSAAHGGRADIATQEEVDEFLAPFASPYTGRFWEEDHLQGVRALLPDGLGATINVWNPGCGSGYEAYSIACLIRSAYPDARIKVWASDNDLLNVSTAPNLVFDRRAVPSFYESYLTEGTRGLSFSADIRQIVLFEYSDITHLNSVPACDIIVLRDVLSYLPERDQRKVLSMIEDKATPSTLIITGSNEELGELGGFSEVSGGPVRAYTIA